jgi:hypothetical protein
MTTNVLDLIKHGLPGNFSDLAGKLVGESPGATQTAVTSALPALVAAIAQKGATADGAQGVLSLLDNPALNTGALSNLSGLLGGQGSTSLTNAGSGLLSSLLGDKSEALAGTLASVSGLRNAQSASSLLALLAPIVLTFIKRLVSEKGLGASGLASVLAGQGQFLQGTLDRRLTGALGFASPSALLDSLGGKAPRRWVQRVQQWHLPAPQSDRQGLRRQARRSAQGPRRRARRSVPARLRPTSRPVRREPLRDGCAGCRG